MRRKRPLPPPPKPTKKQYIVLSSEDESVVQRIVTVVPRNDSASISCTKFYGHPNRSNKEAAELPPTTSTTEFSGAANGNKNVPPEIDPNVPRTVSQRMIQVEFDLTIMRHVRHIKSIRDPRSWQQLLRTRPDLFGGFSPSDLQSYCMQLAEKVDVQFYRAHTGEWHEFSQLVRSLS